MPIVVEEVSVESLPEAAAPRANAGAAPGAGAAREPQEPLPEQLERLQERRERVHAH
jgi:hypothetical protein